jgi:phosphoribosylanthranilate isomerase
MTIIKICGLTETEGVSAVLQSGADYMGFVFNANSVRNIAPDKAAALAEPARGKAKIVAVMVNPGDKLVDKVVSQLKPDYLQLHGREKPERVRTLWKKYHIPVIKALAVSGVRDVEDSRRYAHTASQLLLDARAPKGADQAGGHGTAFDWSILQACKPEKQWFLAGGLTADNIAQAIAQTGAPGVDVSSGVEAAPGIKDAIKIAAFVQAVRSAGASL